MVKHLEEFPEDNDARQKLAMLYAHHYQRLDLAVAELEQLIAQTQAPPRKVIEWLNLLADWQIELEQNEEAARLTLERIIELYPGHAAAQMAQQRLGRLKLELRKAEVSQSVKLGAYEQDLGLKWGRPKNPATPSAPPP
ncbi:MAG: hypothetical protein NTW03_11855 [Verrucomicrobia bacterium]|nr:hypothetical protein [Verrucomicrobiota bacterium]